MKLDATDLRYVTPEEFRVLSAVEIGSKNHEIVPTVIIVQVSKLRNGGVNKLLGSLAKRNLVARVQNAKYDGYRLTYGGYDFLAMRAFLKRDSLYSVGNQIGVGKEADIYLVADNEGKEMVLKLHRLGRISFRAIKEKRDYLGKRQSASWMYMSRLAAQKEWAFMKVLYDHDFPVPRPIDQARHCILMSHIDAYPLRQIAEVPNAGKLYSTLMDLIVRFARVGLIHGDFNEFNILIQRDSGDPIVIDFPQMVSTSHQNAEWYFNRDVECIRTFFKRRFKYESSLYPKFQSTKDRDGEEHFRLDVEVAASGFSKKEQKVLEDYMETVKTTEPNEGDEDLSDGEEMEEDEDEVEEDVLEGEEEDDNDEDEDEGEGTEKEQDSSTHDVDIAETENTHSKSHRSSAPTPDPNAQKASHSPTVAGTDPHLSDTLSSPRHLSRSPPESRSPSPDTLARMTAQLSLQSDMRDRVSTDLAKQRARQQKKYHSKRGAQKAGRAKGSKAKQDTRIKQDKGGFWE